ncbi:nuclear transport factor 2 family protein [Actinocorallia longicatena]|uniref:Nuclear transport factor 2 family protein n=2 Tax=Actinocorallia longicatena TaxID=111803 RepID=A0ABP6Q559_9ACTN
MDDPLLAARVAAGVQDAVAAYARALDAGLPDAVATLFTPDGVTVIDGQGVFTGRAEIRAAYAGFRVTRPQLHLVTNTVVTRWTAEEASAVSDLAFFRLGRDGWAVRLVGRYDDTLRPHEGAWLFHHRHATFLS